MDTRMENGELVIELSGRIDSNNIARIEKEIMAELSGLVDINIAFDALNLNYISSAGLRVLLKVRKKLK